MPRLTGFTSKTLTSLGKFARNLYRPDLWYLRNTSLRNLNNDYFSVCRAPESDDTVIFVWVDTNPENSRDSVYYSTATLDLQGDIIRESQAQLLITNVTVDITGLFVVNLGNAVYISVMRNERSHYHYAFTYNTLTGTLTETDATLISSTSTGYKNLVGDIVSPGLIAHAFSGGIDNIILYVRYTDATNLVSLSNVGSSSRLFSGQSVVPKRLVPTYPNDCYVAFTTDDFTDSGSYKTGRLYLFGFNGPDNFNTPLEIFSTTEFDCIDIDAVNILEKDVNVSGGNTYIAVCTTTRNYDDSDVIQDGSQSKVSETVIRIYERTSLGHSLFDTVYVTPQGEDSALENFSLYCPSPGVVSIIVNQPGADDDSYIRQLTYHLQDTGSTTGLTLTGREVIATRGPGLPKNIKMIDTQIYSSGIVTTTPTGSSPNLAFLRNGLETRSFGTVGLITGDILTVSGESVDALPRRALLKTSSRNSLLQIKGRDTPPSNSFIIQPGPELDSAQQGDALTAIVGFPNNLIPNGDWSQGNLSSWSFTRSDNSSSFGIDSEGIILNVSPSSNVVLSQTVDAEVGKDYVVFFNTDQPTGSTDYNAFLGFPTGIIGQTVLYSLAADRLITRNISALNDTILFEIDVQNDDAVNLLQIRLRFVYMFENAPFDTSPSYNLVSSVTPPALSIAEGNNFTITLNTENVSEGTQVPYTITGVELADLDGETSLTGVFTIQNGTDTKTFTAAADRTTEGQQTFLLSLDNGEDSQSVRILDTSLTPTYSLSASSLSVDEGTAFTVTLTTTNVFDDEEFPYTVTGIQEADLSVGNLSGVFTVTSNSAVANFTVSADALTEGEQIFTLSLDNGEDDISVTINDTSLTPTYSLTASNSTVDEGSTITVLLSTTNVPDGTAVPFTITGITTLDLENTPGSIGQNLTGNFTVNSNSAEIIIGIREDNLTEGSETLTLGLDNGADSISITINDTSLNPIGVYDFANNNTIGTAGTPVSATRIDDEISTSDNGANYYKIEVSRANNQTATGPQVVFQALTRTNDWTLSYWFNRLTPTFLTSSTDYDIFEINLGSGLERITIGFYPINGVGTPRHSLRYYDSNGTLSLEFNTSYAWSSFEDFYVWTFDESFRQLEHYRNGFRSNAWSNVTNNTLDNLWSQLFIGGSGPSPAASWQVSEVRFAPLYRTPTNFSFGSYPNPSSQRALVRSREFEPTDRIYSIVSDVNQITEAGTATFTVSATNVPDNDTVGWTISGVSTDDIDTTLGSGYATALTGTFTIVSGTASISVTMVEDFIAEGTETLRMTLAGTDSNGSITGSPQASVNIVDSSNQITEADLYAEYLGGYYVGTYTNHLTGVSYDLIHNTNAFFGNANWDLNATQSIRIPADIAFNDGYSSTYNYLTSSVFEAGYRASLFNLGGYTDWYLPSVNEMQVIGALGWAGFDASLFPQAQVRNYVPWEQSNGNLSYYWTTTELSAFSVYALLGATSNGFSTPVKDARSQQDLFDTETYPVYAIRRFERSRKLVETFSRNSDFTDVYIYESSGTSTRYVVIKGTDMIIHSLAQVAIEAGLLGIKLVEENFTERYLEVDPVNITTGYDNDIFVTDVSGTKYYEVYLRIDTGSEDYSWASSVTPGEGNNSMRQIETRFSYNWVYNGRFTKGSTGIEGWTYPGSSDWSALPDGLNEDGSARMTANWDEQNTYAARFQQELGNTWSEPLVVGQKYTLKFTVDTFNDVQGYRDAGYSIIDPSGTTVRLTGIINSTGTVEIDWTAAYTTQTLSFNLNDVEFAVSDIQIYKSNTV